ncbi:MAG: response regulator [Vulcanimicrobiaceae bacterium]
MDSPDRVLIVDDDREIRTLLAEYLDDHGYAARTAAGGTAMWRALQDGACDAIILDLSLPGEDGLELCRKLRARSEVPIVMLTARGGPADRILGLETGADDYLPKPFEPRELLARIRNVLRRSTGQRPGAPARRLRFGEWVLDLTSRSLIDRHGIVAGLSGAEFRLLEVFVSNPNVVLSRSRLLDLTRRDAETFDRSVDLQVSRLRQRLDDDARTPELIKTIRGEGYVLATTVRDES